MTLPMYYTSSSYTADHEEDAYLDKDKFTRSFSPSDSFEDIFSIEDESTQGTKVLFCKSLDMTSDEEGGKGVKRTYEETRDHRRFEPSKKPCKLKCYSLPPRHSNHSFRSLRSYASPMSLLSSRLSARNSKRASTRSVSSKSNVSTKTQSDGPNWISRNRHFSRGDEKTGKVKKKQEKENLSPCNDEKECVHYVTAPAVVVSIEDIIPPLFLNERNQWTETIDQVTNGQNAPLRLISNLGFLPDFERGICTVYATPVIRRPPSVRITELWEGSDTGTVERLSPIDHDDEKITHATSDMVMEMNSMVSGRLLGGKAMSAGPSNLERKRLLRLSLASSLEKRRLQIRHKMGENTGSNDTYGGEINDQRKEVSQMVESPTKICGEQPRARKSPIRLKDEKLRSCRLQKESYKTKEEDDPLRQQYSSSREQSPSFQEATILGPDSETVLREKARNNAMRNLYLPNNGNADTKCRSSSGAGSLITEGFPAPGSDYVPLESNSGDSYETAGPRRRSSSSPRRPPSRRPHLSPSSPRAGTLNGKPIQKPPSPPRTLLTMQMPRKPDPDTTSKIREQLGTEIQITTVLKERSIPETKTFTDGKLGTVATHKRAGHPLQNRTLQDFIEERKRILSNQGVHESRFSKKKNTSISQKRNW